MVMSRLMMLTIVSATLSACGLSDEEKHCRSAVDRCEELADACRVEEAATGMFPACDVPVELNCSPELCGTEFCRDELKRANEALERMRGECP